MATFIEDKKKQRKLVYILIAALIITVLILWYGFLRQPTPIDEIIGGRVSEFRMIVEIDFSLLERPLLRELRQFEGTKPFEDSVGRENPFIPF